ncbi:hypothetical protein HK102_010035, partial [Quaeritorhiza haematococci]
MEYQKQAVEYAQVAFDIVKVLHDVHKEGIIHDVRPANIIITDDGRGVLIDWGFSRK